MMKKQSLVETLKWRYAVLKFDPAKKVSVADLNYILEAGNLMPTSYGLQPFRFVVITSQTTKEKLVPQSWNQRHVADNSYLIVLAARNDIGEAMVAEYTKRIEKIRGLPAGAADQFKKTMIGDLTNHTPEQRLFWAQKQTYLALGGMMTAASEKGIDNHAMEGFLSEKYNEILNLTERKLEATVLLALGYRSPEDKRQLEKKVRVAQNKMVIFIE